MNSIGKYLNKLKPYLSLILRVGLGLVLFLDGFKKIFPGRGGMFGLVNYVTNQKWGWLSTQAIDFIRSYLTRDLGLFLAILGWLQLVLAILLIIGLFTREGAIVSLLLFFGTISASPLGGATIILSHRLALIGIAVAVAVLGSGKLSLDFTLRGIKEDEGSKYDLVAIILRISLAYVLIFSSLFKGGMFNNALNRAMPEFILFFVGVLFLVGLFVEEAAVAMILLTGFLVLTKLFIYPAEVALLAASIILLVTGSGSIFTLTDFIKQYYKQG